jgi:hypothetical protein
MKRALIVGIDDYPTAPLHVCVQDARRIGALLALNGDSSRNFDCELLCSGNGIAITRKLLWDRIEHLLSPKASSAFFYFSGHGSINLLGGYLITQDGTKDSPGIAFHDLIQMVQRSAVPEITLVIDCCYSGELGNTTGANTELAVLREGVSILTASTPAQVSMTGFNGSVFSNILAHALSGEAADLLGSITVASIYYHADSLLTAWDQRPMFKCHLSEMAPLRQVAPKIPLATLRKLTELFPTIDHEIQLDPEFENDKSFALGQPTSVNRQKEALFDILQSMRNVNLMEPCPPHVKLYFAAIQSGRCKLTQLGQFYWRMVRRGVI